MAKARKKTKAKRSKAKRKAKTKAKPRRSRARPKTKRAARRKRRQPKRGDTIDATDGLAPGDLAAALQATPAGADFSKATILEDVDAGLETHDDGSIDLPDYAAWLLQRHGYGETEGKDGAGPK